MTATPLAPDDTAQVLSALAPLRQAEKKRQSIPGGTPEHEAATDEECRLEVLVRELVEAGRERSS
jgi:hypothetical protein